MKKILIIALILTTFPFATFAAKDCPKVCPPCRQTLKACLAKAPCNANPCVGPCITCNQQCMTTFSGCSGQCVCP